MKKKRLLMLVLTAAISVTFMSSTSVNLEPSTLSASASENNTVSTTQDIKRLSGLNRYETSLEIAKEFNRVAPVDPTFSISNETSLVLGDNFTDAITVAPYIYQMNGPVIMVKDKNVDNNTKEFLNKRKPGCIVLASKFSSSYSEEVNIKENLKSYTKASEKGYENSVRILADPDPYLQSASFADHRLASSSVVTDSDNHVIGESLPTKGETLGPKLSDTVFVANVDTFADALSASSFAAMYNIPILLTDKDYLGHPTDDITDLSVKDIFINSKRYKVKNAIILGGTGVVSESVENEIKDMGVNTTRLGGANRYETAMKVIKYFDKGQFKGLTIASGKNFPDSITGAPLAAATKSPIMIYDKTSASPEVREFIKERFKFGYVLGGEGVTPTEDMKELLNNPSQQIK